jgi:hypothetical protein
MVKLALGILALSMTTSVGLAEEMTVATPDAISRLHPFLPKECNSPLVATHRNAAHAPY